MSGYLWTSLVFRCLLPQSVKLNASSEGDFSLMKAANHFARLRNRKGIRSFSLELPAESSGAGATINVQEIVPCSTSPSSEREGWPPHMRAVTQHLLTHA